MNDDHRLVWPYAEQSQFFKVHNSIVDQVMCDCPPNAFKILLFILRKTKGFGKHKDTISYSQIHAATGIKSGDTVCQMLKWLEDNGHVDVERHRDEQGRQTHNTYSINELFHLAVPNNPDHKPIPKNGVGGIDPVPKNGSGPVPKIGDTKDTVLSTTKETKKLKNPVLKDGSKEADASPGGTSKPKTLKAKTKEENERAWEYLIATDPNAGRLVLLGELYAEANVTGEVQASRLWREIGAPYVLRRDGPDAIPLDAWAYGLDEAISRGKASLPYARSAAAGYTAATKTNGRPHSSKVHPTNEDMSGWNDIGRRS